MADVKDWILRMRENGYAFQTIKNHKRSLSAAFITAAQNDMVRKNPFEFDIADVIPNDTERKEALSPEQENAFLNYIKNSPIFGKYYDAVIVLSGTGMRISEFCGLTVDDIDMESRIINVDHQLIYPSLLPQFRMQNYQCRSSTDLQQAKRLLYIRHKNKERRQAVTNVGRCLQCVGEYSC